MCSTLLVGCIFMRGGYSFSGASIPEAAKTFSVAYFPNNAPMVSPTLSTMLTESLKDKFSRQTKLQMVEEGGDFAFEGEITGYSSTTASVSSDNYAQLNRLTITVRVEFTNVVEPQNSFTQSFSQFADYDSQQLLTDIQSELDQQIVDQLVTDIFMAAAANW
ncbi:MAG: LptE family protein [Alistipes sp.]|nr:LptE family protein [Alistipes sp.]MBQ8437238.1 LptE family protein [Alistipes sp.]MBQ8552752.1 LptE family protein [Alistipes sp.]MBR2073170.1 LptE family protein [Alistipes sp.]MBR3774482.1 LptE family protein [Alistipes sp.]